jgi:hypothetical protein
MIPALLISTLSGVTSSSKALGGGPETMSRRGGSAHLKLHTGNVVRSSLIRNSLTGGLANKVPTNATSPHQASWTRGSVSQPSRGSSDAFPSRAA